MEKMSPKRLVWLDLVRGLSAVAVCAMHLRAAIFVDFGLVPDRDLVSWLFYFSTSIGHQAVIIFFVLSGFFVGGSVLSRADSFSWQPYLLARLSRLWVVLFPALFLTLIIDSIFAQQAPSVLSGGFRDMWGFTGPDPNGTYSAGPIRFLSNLFFLQTVATPVYGSNIPLWSLANEFWYYLLFPLALTLCARRFRVRQRVVAGSLILVLLVWLPTPLLGGMLVWLIGVGVWWLAKNERGLRKWLPLLLVLGLASTLGSLVWVKSPQIQPPFGMAQDLPVGFGFAVLALPLVFMPVRGTWGRAVEWISQRLSDISYSLYLSHFPLTLAVSVFIFKGRQIQPSLWSYFIFTVILALIVFAGWGFWLLFERHTTRVRIYLETLKVRPCQTIPLPRNID
jgi:peptidoglycan/LPS O-acetylase OafA/YrhL